MTLWRTLKRRGAKSRGHFSLDLRRAVIFDITTAIDGGIPTDHSQGKVLHQIRMEMMQHAFSGVEPQGKNVAYAHQALGRNGLWPLICAYILDAEEDVVSLDAVSVVLRTLVRIANIHESRFGGFEGWQDTPEDCLPPEIKYAYKVEDLIKTINERLRDGDVGFQFTGGDVQDFVMSPEPLLHDQVVEPTLHALARHEELAVTDKEYARALDAWKREDYKQAVDHAYESVEGILRVIVKLANPSKFKSSLLINASVDRLAGKKLWHGVIGSFMKDLQALRGDLGGHSEGTKPRDRVASAEDAATAVFIAGALLVHLAAVFERLSAEKD